MYILAVDQAKHGAMAVFDYNTKELVDYKIWSFGGMPYERVILNIEATVEDYIAEKNISAVFYEDIQFRKNWKIYKRLAQLQGVLVNLAEKIGLYYGLVMASTWQSYCGMHIDKAGETKDLSKQIVQELYGIETKDDNLADAILIGHYVVNNIEIAM